MELKDFISQTLVEIQTGVQEAIDKTIAAKTKGAINPVWGTTNDISRSDLQRVEFDIAVTVAEKSTGTVDAGIKVLAVNLGGKGSTASETSNVSRIRFSIPVIPPVTTINDRSTETNLNYE